MRDWRVGWLIATRCSQSSMGSHSGHRCCRDWMVWPAISLRRGSDLVRFVESDIPVHLLASLKQLVGFKEISEVACNSV